MCIGSLFLRQSVRPAASGSSPKYTAERSFDNSLAVNQLYTQNKSSVRQFFSSHMPNLGQKKYQQKFAYEAQRSDVFANRFAVWQGREHNALLYHSHKLGLIHLHKDVASGAVSPKQGLAKLSELHKHVQPQYEEQAQRPVLPLEVPNFDENFASSVERVANTQTWMMPKTFSTLYRVDDRPYTEIFQNGFRARKPLAQPTLAHVKEQAGAGASTQPQHFVSSTKSRDVAESENFLSGFAKPYSGTEQQYYVIRDAEGLDAEDFPKFSDTDDLQGSRWQQEVMVSDVPARNIEKVVVRFKDGRQTEIRNPNARF